MILYSILITIVAAVAVLAAWSFANLARKNSHGCESYRNEAIKAQHERDAWEQRALIAERKNEINASRAILFEIAFSEEQKAELLAGIERRLLVDRIVGQATAEERE